MELRVSDHLAAEGVELFLEAAPRSLALCGGSTPRPLYERLAGTRYAWPDVDAFLGDERCVPPDHPASNFGLANEALLSRVAARAHPVVGCDPDAYASELEAVLGPGLPRFDLVWLGLGEDGHTASLFPGDPALDVSDRTVVRVERPDCPRVTLTLPVLSAARLAVFLVAGEHKREALAGLLAGRDLPAARVRAERVIVLADRAATATAG